MSALRFVPSLFTLACVQLGLWSALAHIFALGRRGKLALALAQALLALFFVAFLIEARNGLQLRAGPRAFLVEPLLAVEVFSVLLMLVLGIALSAARRWPGGFSERRRIFLSGAAKGLMGLTGA